MRLATITLFGMIMMCPAPGYSQSALWDVEAVNKGLFMVSSNFVLRIRFKLRAMIRYSNVCQWGFSWRQG